MTYFDNKIKLLMDRVDVPSKDILSHKWEVLPNHSKEELWLRCKTCGYYYSVSVFENGTILRFFVKSLNQKHTEKFMSCDQSIMNSALK